MLMKILKLIVGILSIPLMFGVTYAFYVNITAVSQLSGILQYFVWGVVSYVALHLLFYKPTAVYVLGHEAVHGIFAWIMGGKIQSFNVSKEGGSVTTDKTNTFIELSPYFVPIYAIILMAVYYVISYSYKINGAAFIYLIGFALAFHVVMTIEVMKIRQPDILKSGYLFSIVFVYVLNIIIIALLFSLMFRSFSAKHFFIDTWNATKGVYIGLIKQLFS
jgi:hypothetical protein